METEKYYLEKRIKSLKNDLDPRVNKFNKLLLRKFPPSKPQQEYYIDKINVIENEIQILENILRKL